MVAMLFVFLCSLKELILNYFFEQHVCSQFPSKLFNFIINNMLPWDNISRAYIYLLAYNQLILLGNQLIWLNVITIQQQYWLDKSTYTKIIPIESNVIKHKTGGRLTFGILFITSCIFMHVAILQYFNSLEKVFSIEDFHMFSDWMFVWKIL